jgi:hypothetical protein
MGDVERVRVNLDDIDNTCDVENIAILQNTFIRDRLVVDEGSVAAR